MRELFVYYRVDPDKADQAQLAVQAMHAGLRSRIPGLQARLYKRGDGVQTWMETYALAEVGIDDATELQITAAAARLALLICGARHTEAFVPCAS